jgi:CRP/FNR family transcriptional regulator
MELNELKRIFPVISETKLQEIILETGTLKSYEAGDEIMHYGEYIRFVPLIVKGTIKVLRQSPDTGHEVFLYNLQAGETCAMAFTCCMMNKKSEIKTIADEATEILAIPIKKMDEWMSTFPSWKNFIMLSYNSRFHELINALDSIAFLKLDVRLIKILSKKSAQNLNKEILITHQELANELNASREAISRLLKKLEILGLIQLGRNRISLVKTAEEIEQWIEEAL